MKLFAEDDYRSALSGLLLEKKQQFGKPFTFQAMASACKVQKAYLSKVLKGQGHLSEDQVFLAAGFLGLDATEQEFIELLHAYGRSTVPKRRTGLKRRLDQYRQKQMRTERHLGAEVTTVGIQPGLEDYYLDPLMQLVHMFLTVPRFAAAPDAVARDLGLTKAQLNDVLERLTRLKIVTFENGRYRVLRDNLHLAPGSRVYDAYRVLLRLRALEQIQRNAAGDAYNFSVVFSADGAARQALQLRLFELVKAAEADVRGAAQEDVYQLNLDLFKWSR